MVVGHALTKEDNDTLSNLRTTMYEETDFNMREGVDTGDSIHFMIGYLKEVPADEKMSALKDELTTLLEEWSAEKDSTS